MARRAVKAVDKGLAAIDQFQRRHKAIAIPYAVVKKFGDDRANLYVVALGWYGFTAIYPLLLVVVTVLGFIGADNLGASFRQTVHSFPIIGKDLTPAPGARNLHGSLFGLIVGLAGLLYGAQGVTQTAQQAMAQVWNVKEVHRPAFLPRLARSIGGLVIIGGAFVLNAAMGHLVVASHQSLLLRAVATIVLVLIDVLAYLGAFVVLTPAPVGVHEFLPGAVLAGVGFTLLTTLGTGLVEHQIRHMNDTYGAFASIIGVVTYLLLLAKLSVFAAELNPVLARHLWPRGLVMSSPTDADDRVLRHLVEEEQRREDEHIGVGFHQART